MIKTIRAAIQYITKGMRTVVMTGRFHTRHGSDGLDKPRVFSKMKAAHEAVADSVEVYLKSHGAIDVDGNINYDAVHTINGDGVIDGKVPYKTIKELRKSLMGRDGYDVSIDIDNDGTWAEWCLNTVICED